MTDVIAALAKVQADIGGIAKRRGGEGGISYAYRGIDAISSEAQPLFGREGIVIVPTEATITSVDQITVNGKPWTDTFVSVSWTIYGPGGANDQITAVTQGIGRDNSDKGYNKAATQAFKNLLLRILCIGDPQDDADTPAHQNNATDARVVEPTVDREAAALIDAITAAPVEVRDAVKAWRPADKKLTAPAFTADPAWREQVESFLAEQIASQGETPESTTPREAQ
jgi:hypothetical protein